VHEGPHGAHIVLVMPVMGMDLDICRQSHLQAKVPIPIPTVKRVAGQLLLGLQYLHEKCGIVHTGEIILWSFKFELAINVGC
jgi:serine/threonine-protein kinase SRPK3